MSSVSPLSVAQEYSDYSDCDDSSPPYLDVNLAFPELDSTFARIDEFCSGIPVPSLNDLVNEYRNRDWDPALCWRYFEVGGYRRTDEELDQQILLVVAKRYLKLFGKYKTFFYDTDYGLFHGCRNVGEGYIRADIHGDLVTTLGLLKHLQELGLRKSSKT